MAMDRFYVRIPSAMKTALKRLAPAGNISYAIREAISHWIKRGDKKT